MGSESEKRRAGSLKRTLKSIAGGLVSERASDAIGLSLAAGFPGRDCMIEVGTIDTPSARRQVDDWQLGGIFSPPTKAGCGEP
jgi:hypothetical protein